MPQGETAIMRAQPFEGGSLESLLATVLALSGDAIVAFDGAGTVLLANDEALRLMAPAAGMRTASAGMVGIDVRSLFPSMEGMGEGSFSLADLPFATDGTSQQVVCSDADGRPMELVVRCERVGGPVEAYLLVARRSDETGHERERLVSELSRANRRLAGTLDIVLGTLDSPSVGTLFERVLEELCTTMDASGTTVYLAEPDGFHLRGTSASLAGLRVPRFLAAQRSLVALVSGSSGSVRLRVLPPEGEQLRRGKLVHRTVADETTGKTYRVRSSQLPPFASFLAVPVRFGGQVIALIEVGWTRPHAIARDDAGLLDAVTRYLAVQLVGAFGAMRAQRRDQLATRANDLRDVLVADAQEEGVLPVLLDAVTHDLDCGCLALRPAVSDGAEELVRPDGTAVLVPDGLVPREAGIVAFEVDSALGTWLADQGEPCLGAVVDGGDADGERVRFLAVRQADGEPFDDLELDYLHQVTDTVRALATGDRGRRRDHRISQALQQGMRSELQQVEGIRAQGIYSSATEAAFVGGDFYDLIRLPDRRACVIMGDVSGKGVEAASVSAAVRTALGAYSWEGLAPARMVELLNDFLLGFSRLETFATLFVGIVDLAAGTLTYCSAGHPPALLVRAATGELVLLEVQSGVVGAFHEMTYRDGVVELGRGDTLVLYTDGTTEARAADGSFFGEEGLRAAVLREVGLGFEGLLERLLATVEAFTGNSLDDDVAMVSLRFEGVGEDPIGA